MYENIIQNLKDADCDSKMIEKFLETDNTSDKVNLLTRYRAKLLENLHVCQKKLDCLDYLIFNLKQEGEYGIH